MIFEEIDIVVSDLCEIALGDMDHKKYTVVLKNTVRSLRKLGMVALPTYKTIELEVSDILTVQLPDDCLLPLKVGVCQNGNITEIFTNEDICKKEETGCTCACASEDAESSDVQTSTESSSGSRCSFCTFYYNDNRHGQSFHEAYWVRPGMSSLGNFIYDQLTDTIAIGSNSLLEAGDKLLISYKSDITLSDEQATLVPMLAWDALFYKTKEIFGKERVSLKRTYRANYETEYNFLKRFFRRKSKQEWENMILGTKHSDIRR